jgi:perosamine synthetase
VITDKTKAVIVVDLYGGMPDWDSIRALATDRGIAVIEDAAQAIGSEYRGKKAGSFGDTGVFSFHGSKTLTTGEGGMLVTDREDLYKRCLFLRDHGRVPGEKMFWNSEVACKYKMSSMQAALGLAQLERIDELIKRKRDIFSWYKEELSDLTGLCINREPAGTKNSYWMVTAVPTKAGMEKELVIKLMGEHKIDCRPFFYPLSSLPAYKDLIQAHEAEKRNAVSYRISPYGFNLPSNLKIERQQVSRICDSLRRIMGASESSRYGSKQ